MVMLKDLELDCIICKSKFKNTSRTSREVFLKRKYCSRLCSNGATVGDRIINNPKAKEKISAKLKGREKSLEHCKNISASLKVSEKAKQTQFKKGKENPAFGSNQTGVANHNWKGGKTTKNQKLRNDPQYKVWRRECMERDHFKCQDCNTTGFLQVHHLKSVSDFPDLIWVVSNGKTVCVPCHEKIHGRFIGKFKQKQ